MYIENLRVKNQIEAQIALAKPIFGEETGEFVDFTKYNEKSARL